jgi:hypothetical protein
LAVYKGCSYDGLAPRALRFNYGLGEKLLWLIMVAVVTGIEDISAFFYDKKCSLPSFLSFCFETTTS